MKSRSQARLVHRCLGERATQHPRWGDVGRSKLRVETVLVDISARNLWLSKIAYQHPLLPPPTNLVLGRVNTSHSAEMRPIARPQPALSRQSVHFVCRACIGRRFFATETVTPLARPDIYDVVCVGGGPAGLSLLTALRANRATSALRVALVEAQDLANVRSWKATPGSFSNRCSSLTPLSRSFLASIGAWDHVAYNRIQPYHEMQVWDGITGQRIEFTGLRSALDVATGPENQKDIVAYMAENANLTHALLKRLDQLGETSFFSPAAVENISYAEKTAEGYDFSSWPRVTLQDGRFLIARLLVGADGANSPVRKFAGIPSRGWDYDRQGVVATLALESDAWGHENFKTAYQRFLPTGPVAMLPLSGNRATLVWSTTPERASLLKSLSARDFCAMVNAAFRLRMVDIDFMHTLSSGHEEELSWRSEHTPLDLQKLPQKVFSIQDGSVAAFPLRMRHADTYVAERVALVGDAAHTVHPLAGQGLNGGQADVASLVKQIEFAVTHGMDIGSSFALEGYVRERYLQNHIMLGVCDKLHKLYSVASGPLVSLRSLGLGAVNGLAPLKNFIMRQAAGTGTKMFL